MSQVVTPRVAAVRVVLQWPQFLAASPDKNIRAQAQKCQGCLQRREKKFRVLKLKPAR